jgi:hypothetical protein
MVLKFLHIQSHFIHLYFLTVFEVIFYIYYIMPYEKTIFNHLFDDEISSLSKLNITNYISDGECSEYQNKLDSENKHLWNLCFIYIASSSALFLIIFIRDIWKNYSSYKLITTTSAPSSPRYDSKSAIVSFGSFQNLNIYKKNDDTSTEMVSIPKLAVNDNNSSVTTDIIENPTFIKYYWYNSGFLSELIKTLEFIVLVGIFEYLFFAYIVNKFKIANSKTILCSIYKKIS